MLLVFYRSRVLNELYVGNLLDFPLVSRNVVLRVDEALPVVVVDLVEVAAIVVAGIPRLLTEQDVTRMGFHRQDAVIVLPATHQLVQVAGSHLGGVFLRSEERRVGKECRSRW